MSYDNIPYINGKPKQQINNTKSPTKCSITQRLRTDLVRSKGWVSPNNQRGQGSLHIVNVTFFNKILNFSSFSHVYKTDYTIGHEYNLLMIEYHLSLQFQKNSASINGI